MERREEDQKGGVHEEGTIQVKRRKNTKRYNLKKITSVGGGSAAYQDVDKMREKKRRGKRARILIILLRTEWRSKRKYTPDHNVEIK